MKAVLQNSFGPPTKVLSIGEVPQPEIQNPGDVLVKIKSSTVNTPDWISTLGIPYIIRPVFGGLRGPRNRLLGSDVAGIVEQVGSDVNQFQAGDAVFGCFKEAETTSSLGTFAEYAVIPASRLLKKPQSVSFHDAASCVMSGCTAFCAVQAMKITPGSHILINGASGSVGTLALQMAKAQGATVTAVCSGKNAEMMKEIGADYVIDYTKEDFTKSSKKYDVVLDNVLNRSYKEMLRVLKADGYIIPNSVGTSRGNWCGAIPAMIAKPRNSPLIDCDCSPCNLEAVVGMVESGKVRILTDKVFDLDHVPEAIEYMSTLRARGQVVIQIN